MTNNLFIVELLLLFLLHCQETLSNQRQAEKNRQLETWKIQLLEARLDTDVEADHMETEQLAQSDEETFTDEPSDERLSVNGMSETKEAEEQHRSPDDNNISPFLVSRDISNKRMNAKLAGNQAAVTRHEWIEMGVRGDQAGNPIEEEEQIVESQIIDEPMVTFDRRGSNLNNSVPTTPADSLRHNTAGPNVLLIGGLPDVDYPTNEESTSQLSYPQTVSWGGPDLQRPPEKGGMSIRRNSESQSVDQNSCDSDSDGVETVTQTWGSKQLRSPGLQRKRPLGILQAPLAQKFKQEAGETFAASNENNSSNCGPDNNLNNKRNSIPSGQSTDSHRVLKLGSLKPNQGMFWNINDREPDQDLHSKRTKLNTPGSISIANISSKGGNARPLPYSNPTTLPKEQDTSVPMSEHNLNGHHSPLEGILERAKGRQRERDVLKSDKDLKMASERSKYPPSPSFSTAPSPSPSDVDRDTEFGEKEVELTRHRASTVSEIWKEQLVDEEDDEKRNRLVPCVSFV